MITAAKGMLPENPKNLKKLVTTTKSYVIPNPMFEDDMKKHKVLYDLALSQLTGQFLRALCPDVADKLPTRMYDSY